MLLAHGRYSHTSMAGVLTGTTPKRNNLAIFTRITTAYTYPLIQPGIYPTDTLGHL